MISTYAGIAGSGFSGDGGAPTNAALYFPKGLAMDSTGDLFVADAENNRIREVTWQQSGTIILAGISLGNEGNYSVIIGNAYGSVTSTVAALTVVGPPMQISPPQSVAASGSLMLNFATGPGYGYTIEMNTNLAESNWTYYTNFIRSSTNISLLIPVSQQQQFFRVRQP